MKLKKIRRKEKPADRGKYHGTAYKKIGFNAIDVVITGRKKATSLDVKREMVRVSQASDDPVTFEEVDRVFKHFPTATSNLLISFGEVKFSGLGTLYNILVDKHETTKKYQSRGDDGKKLGYKEAFIRTIFRVADGIKASMNGRKTHAEKVRENKEKNKEMRKYRERDAKEEDAALALYQLWEDGLNIDLHFEKYWELIWWNDFSCYHTVSGNKVNQLPVRKDSVRDRFLSILVDVGGGSRYISVWDEHMSIPALEARGIVPDLNKWPGHDWSHEGYVNWSNRRGKGI